MPTIVHIARVLIDAPHGFALALRVEAATPTRNLNT
jgi:hypothetical protein